MSSILRALKKLDEETRSQEGLAGIPKIEVDHMVTRHPQSTFRKVIFITVPVLVLMVAVWVMFNSRPEKQPEKPKLPVATTQKPESSKAHAPASEQKKTTPDASPQSSTQSQPAVPAQPAAIGEEETAPPPPPEAPKDEPVQTGPSGPAPAGRQKSGSRIAYKRDADGRKIMMPSRTGLNDGRSRPSPFPVPQRSPQSAQTAQTSTAAQNPPKVRPQFTLEGILWSQNVKRRVALINDKYLKEGDTIKGVTILRIERKLVTLKSGDDTWSIRLKR